ncbi:unnamed protein product [Arabidopsis lyrata]|nr:unnamed protein product [Arabidopsis lyrata]
MTISEIDEINQTISDASIHNRFFDIKYHHWFDRKEKREIGGYGKVKGRGGGVRADSSTKIGVGATAAGTTKFPWSNMRFVGL